MAVKDYNTNPDLNTTISGINIAEGCPPSGINNAIRQLMADVKADSEAQTAALSQTMTGATASTAGTAGLVPAPGTGDQDKVLKGDGTWAYLSGMPIGTIFWSASATPVDGAIICNGATPLIATYPDLYAVIGTRYGGDGITTFGVPNMIGRVAWGATTPGTYLEAGLPNITGGGSPYNDVDIADSGWHSPTGAFYRNEAVVAGELKWNGNSSHVGTKSFGFDASRCSAVYGNSDTVQPPALTLVPYIKAYDTVQNVGSMDAAQLASEINRLDGKFLPLTGGTMVYTDPSDTGIVFKNAEGGSIGQFYFYENDSIREIGFQARASDGTNGSVMSLRAKDAISNPNSFVIIARGNGSTGKSLIGSVTGNLTWNGKNIVRSVNGASADANGAAYVYTFIGNSGSQMYLPSGGTWDVLYLNWGTDWGEPYIATLAGGSAIPKKHSRTVAFAIRIS